MVPCHCLGQERSGRFFSLGGWSFNGDLPGTPEAPASFSGQEHMMFLIFSCVRGKLHCEEEKYCLLFKRSSVVGDCLFSADNKQVHPTLSNKSTQGQP